MLSTIKTNKKNKENKFNYNQTYSLLIDCSDLNKTPILIKQVNPSHCLTQNYWENLSAEKQSQWLLKQLNSTKSVPKSSKQYEDNRN